MKTLYGAHQPDEGTILVDGEVQHFRTRRRRSATGSAWCSSTSCSPTTSPSGRTSSSATSRAGRSRPARRRKIRAVQPLRAQRRPDELVSDLGVGEKQRVEILKVLYRGAEILILDEPTAVLVPHEVDELFACCASSRAARRRCFISHKLDEVLAYAGAITVIRAGRTVGEVDDPSSVTAEQLAEMMVGSELPSPETREHGDRAGSCSRSVTSPSSRAPTPANSSASRRAPTCSPAPPVQSPRIARSTGYRSRCHAGEIVGVAGVEGNGQAELIDSIVGLVSATTRYRSTERTSASCRRSPAAPAGIGLIPEDRHRDGMVLAMPLWENAARSPVEPRVQRARSDRPRTPAAGVPRRSSAASTCARRVSTCVLHAVRRQPAEAHRRARDAGQAA